VGIDYYRCKKCDLQVNDADPWHDECTRCDTVICWNCASTLKIREKSVDDSPGRPIQDQYKMKFSTWGTDPETDFECFELLNCPYCKVKDKKKQEKAVLKYLLKKNGLTLKQAVKEMNSQ
jgi:hypothetical protein